MTAPLPRPLPWGQRLIDAADGPVPQYGSPEWEALADDSRAKVAATVVAAECWRTYWSPEEHGRRLRIELEEAHAAEAVWTADIVEQVHRLAGRVARGESYAELCQRRGEWEKAARAEQCTAWRHLRVVADPPTPDPDARPLVPGSYEGGPVTWDREVTGG